MKKVVKDAAAAVSDIPDGASIMMSGFGLSGIPENLIRALRDQGARLDEEAELARAAPRIGEQSAAIRAEFGL